VTGIPGIAELLRVAPGPVDLSAHDPDGRPGFDGNKSAGKRAVAALEDEIVDLQERLAADGYTGGDRRLLLVIQGMDTSGKGGVLKHAVGLLNPGGVRATSFKAPTEEELAHDFLWRIERAVPPAGVVGAFDRSHYEDVLAARVHQYADEAEIERRYGAINDFEKGLVDSSTVVLKCMLHISAEEQRKRLLARLDKPEKRWKFKPGDVDERALWRDYEKVYEIALERCNTDAAPWYVVPSDHKWYRNWAIGQLLLEALRGMDLAWPQPDYDVDEQRARLTGAADQASTKS
jgi:PPK2 family polyphosphate:nucleotide phosphotransferase